jgi:addiction module HigA family antidote
MPAHPGHLLRDGFLAPLGIRPAELARGLGVERSTVSRLLSGKQDLSPSLAARLGLYFQVPARWFLAMQAAYDAERAAADPAVARSVTPRPRDPRFLLTPGGARRLGARSTAPTAPLRIPRQAFRRDADPPAPTSTVVRQVEYDGGAVALVCEPG